MAMAAVRAVFAVLVLLAGSEAEETASTEEFDVKPGGAQYTYTRTLDGFTCSFTYAAQGGTNEKWQMSIGVDKDGQYVSCSIWRPSGTSYLFFLSFRAEITRGKIELCEVYSQKNKQLKKAEYDVTDTSVSDRPGSFNASLCKILLVAKSSHEEL